MNKIAASICFGAMSISGMILLVAWMAGDVRGDEVLGVEGFLAVPYLFCALLGGYWLAR